jgi:hypothetical protein
MTPPRITLVRAGLLALLAAAAPAPARAQVGDVVMGMRNGGGWVGIPIVSGHGSYSTPRLPTGAMSIAGCVNVWWGHSGTWEIRAHESVLGSNLKIDAVPGEGVPFEHDFGMTAQVDIEFEWSEPRDTTLMLWVGLDPTLKAPEETCEPPQS